MIRGIKGSLAVPQPERLLKMAPDSGVSMMMLPPEPVQDNAKMLKALNELEYKVKHHK